jgi:hypothetical protein
VYSTPVDVRIGPETSVCGSRQLPHRGTDGLGQWRGERIGLYQHSVSWGEISAKFFVLAIYGRPGGCDTYVVRRNCTCDTGLGR